MLDELPEGADMIPQTLLWVGLVIAWLVVLVPMLVARHPKVNTVTDATLKTRLLHRGGSARLALRRKIRPSASAPASADGVELAEAHAVELTEEADVIDDLAHNSDRDVAPEREERLARDVDADDELEDAHAFVDSDVDFSTVGHGPLDGDTVPIEPVERSEVQIRRSVPVAPPVSEDGGAEEKIVAEVYQPEDASDDDLHEGEADVETVEIAPAARATDENPADETSSDRALTDEVSADETLTEEVAPVTREGVERRAVPTEYPVDDAPRRRRGGFDPENDARLSEARYRFRQRVTLALGVLAVIALGAGLLSVPFAWYALGVLVVALVLYLAYLRRTVRIEADIRRRRVARLERARREREREAELIDGVPAHRRRGGCVVMEIDDEDPAFDHLPRYRAEEFDFLSPRSDLREPVQRKVG